MHLLGYLSSDTGGGLSTLAIIGIVVRGLVLVALAVSLIRFLWLRAR